MTLHRCLRRLSQDRQLTLNYFFRSVRGSAANAASSQCRQIDLDLINYIGRQAETGEQPPCCNPHIICRDVAFSRNLSLHNLLMKPPYRFKSHLEAFKRMREFASLAIPQRDNVSLQILNESAACLDCVFFGSTLMSRVNICWSTLGEMVGNRLAETSDQTKCTTHRQVHHIKITLDPSRLPELRRCYYKDNLDAVLSSWLERIFGSLIHELYHARINIFMDR